MQRVVYVTAIVWGLLSVGCDDGGQSTDAVDARVDLGGADAQADATPDASADAATDAAPDAAPDAFVDRRGERVEIDLTPHTTPRPGAEGQARVFQSTDASQLIGGPAATGAVGDWIMENGEARFLIEDARRVIGPCPYGGTLIDADIRREGPGEDVIGETCLFMQLGQTFAPDRFEILADGSDGGAAVLAVTGHLELLDFINLNGLLAGLGGGLIRIGFDTETLLPLTVTEYYILRPGDRGVRVVTAMRNDGREAVHTPVGHMTDSGGAVDFFNPSGPFGGFGYRGLSPQAIQAEALVMLAFIGERASYAYVPDADPTLEFNLPRAGSYLSVSGVAVSLLRNDSVLATLLARPESHAGIGGVLHLDPGASESYARWMLVGGANPADVIDGAWAALGTPTGTIRGTAAPGVTVSAIDADERTVGLARTDAEGRFALRTPPGTVRLRGWAPDRATVEISGVVVAADATVEQALEMGPASAVVVQVTRPGGDPTPAKVTVLCEGECPSAPTANDRDVTVDGPLDGAAAVEFLGMDGRARIPVPPGRYRVSVSRGITWSVWPADTIATGGAPIEVAPGAEVAVDAEIAPVIDTRGALSADFHVHGINSPDAPVEIPDRVRTFLAEGVDVLVSTDHDFVTDYRPAIAAAGAESELATIMGLELTTFSYGHFNGFPVQRDPESTDGGAFDWAGGPDLNRHPRDIFAWYAEQPGEQVIQVNHPSGGYFNGIDARPLAGISLTDPTVFRLPPTTPDPVSGDTGLWDEGFTALEILNGLGRDDFWRVGRWWFAMLGRGFTPTATAVSDTHKMIASQAGTPRSFVFSNQTIGDFAPEPLAQAANAGRLIGTSGPFFTVSVAQGEARAGLGDVLAAAPGQVQVEVAIQAPAWMRVTGVDVYANVTEGLDTEESAPSEEPLPATASAPVDWAAAAEVEVAPGHTRREQTVTVPLEVTADTWIVVVVHGDGPDGTAMFPIIHSRGARPFGFSNPVYVDVDGGGFDRPPLLEAAKASRTRLRVKPRGVPRYLRRSDLPALIHKAGHHHDHVHTHSH